MLTCERNARWELLINQLRRELNGIDDAERQWLQHRISLLKKLQWDIHTLFLRAYGPDICRACSGSCCEHGHNHITLINVVAAILAQQLPRADFESACPFLTRTGCSLDVALRPFNCVTFICTQIEAQMSTAQVTEFYRLEKMLREHYLEVDERYAGSSMRGLFIGTQRLNGRPMLGHNTH